MTCEYKRVPLAVQAIFTSDGTVKPKRIIVANKAYDIDRVTQIKRYCPATVPSIAPLEYTVFVEGNEKKIYFEPHSNKWFSVKEVIK